MQRTQPKISLKTSSGKKGFFIGFSLLLLLILLLGAVYYAQTELKIKSVIVNNINSKSSLQGLSLLNDMNMLFLDENDIEKQLYKSNSYIKTISIKKQYPSTLILAVAMHVPLAQFEVSEGYFVLSKNARILKKAKSTSASLPIIRYYQKLSYNGYNAGDTIEFKDIKASLQFLEKAKNLGLAINSIDIRGFNMIALNTKDEKMLFTLEKSIKDQLYQFEQVVKQFKVQGKEFKVIDFRFDRVIVEQ